MEKNPADRYATAQDLADDLRRFLEDKPIRARRPTLWQKLKKWARRNKPVVWTAAVFTFLVIAVLAGCIGLVVWDRAARYAFITAQVDAALQEAMRLQDQGNWPEALSAVKRAEGILAAGANPALDRRAQEIRQDLEMIVKLERVRLDEPILDRFDWGFRARDAAYSAAFREYGLDVTVAPPEEAVDLIRAKSESVRHELITALEDWAFMGRARTPQRTRLLAIVRMADPDVRRNQLRDALERGDGRVLKQLATSKQVVNLPPLSLKLFGDYLALTGAVDEAVALLQLIQGEYLGNFWINVSLAEWLQMTSPPQFDEAIGYYRAALALRPKNGGLHYFFGTALRRKGSLSQAETAYRRAIEFEPGLADAHSSLVGLLAGQGRVEEADEACAAAQRRIPNFGRWLNNRAWHIVYFPDFHRSDSRLAVECAKKAIEIAPDAKYTWNTLGAAYYRAGEWDKAVAALEKSMEIRQGGDSFDWFFLAMAHQKLGHENQARRWYQQAVEWMEKHAPQDEELRHFRPEAEEVLGIRETKSQPQTNADEHS
jgi:tetratricopeptide (TPR) repeat protein